MTIVCLKAGIMAADSALWSEDVVSGHTRKIVRTDCGALVASAGNSVIGARFTQWAIKSKTPWIGFKPELEENEEFSAIIADPNAGIFTLDDYGRSEGPLSDEFIAIGAAAKLAIGCMGAGASAERAVRFCIENHAYVAGKVQVEHLNPTVPSLMPVALADSYLRGASSITIAPDPITWVGPELSTLLPTTFSTMPKDLH